MRGGDEPASDQVPDELDRFPVDEVPVEAGSAGWLAWDGLDSPLAPEYDLCR